MNFTNKNVVITGGSSGIGLATAKAFINAGANVLITGKSTENLQQASAVIGSPNLKTLVADVADVNGIATLEKAVAENGRLDVLYLNAGISSSAPIEQTTEEAFDSMFNINVKGLYFTLQKLIPHLADSSSVIVTSSGVSVGAYLASSAYAATKAAVDAIARVAASELAERRIRVNIVAPGAIDTPIYDKTIPAEAVKATKEHISGLVPWKRMGNAEEVADTVLFLASDAASYITGVYLPVDGGALLRKW